MMKILVVAATEMEILPFREFLKNNTNGLAATIDVLISGVGMTATAYTVTRKLLSHQYDFALEVGVCGSFDKTIALGNVVMVNTDRYGDMGAEDHDTFIDIFDMGLISGDEKPFSNSILLAKPPKWFDTTDLLQVSGITVNTVSGSQKSIDTRKERYKCTVESMEGAAFHYVCLREGILFAQIRAVSNYVIPRDKSTWEMGLAIANLNNWIARFCLDIIPIFTTPNNEIP